MARVCPGFSSTSVSTRRVRMLGISNPENVSPFAKSREDTSGSTWRRMLPLFWMVGVKFRRMPNSFHVMVTAFDWLPWMVGNGNSPPARKDACWPSLVTRFGWARLRNSPELFSARMNTSRAERSPSSMMVTRPSEAASI
jgi:hypothetical protein